MFLGFSLYLVVVDAKRRFLFFFFLSFDMVGRIKIMEVWSFDR